MEQQRQAALPPLPRALDVQRFAGAREQEVRALVTALQGSRLGAKFGVAALPRHLRRRAGSHKPYHGHRLRPNLKLQSKRRKLEPAAGGDGEPGSGDEAAAADEQPAAAAAARLYTNRRMRRQPALLQQQHRESAAWTEASLAAPAAADGGVGTASGNSSSSSSKARRLETHVWHAKRLTMEERYGWLLPAGAAGQGRGSRSFVHEARASALMHDASYLCPLLLSGAWGSVHSALSTLLDPAAAAALAADWADAASGGAGSSCFGWEREWMLHHPGRYPRGAICPAQMLLLPCSGSSAAMDVDGEGGASASHVQACLWVHPAAAAEAHAALQQAVGAGPQVSLAVINVRRLELRGGAADTALAVALAGATASGIASGSSSDGGRGARRKQQRQQHAAAAPQEQQEALPPPPLPQALAGLGHGDAVQLLLPDPRLCKPVALGSAAGSLLQPPGDAASSSSQDEPQPLDLARLLQAPLPLSESDLSSRRQQLRRSMLQLEAAPLGSSNAADQQQGQQGERQARKVQRRGYCPALVVRHEPRERQGTPGWSLILPAGWVPPFWLAAAYAGCKPAGQREWRWLHTLAGRRCAPWDHPDTAAYAALMRQQQLSRLAAAARRPKAKQQLAAPALPPDWAQLLAPGSGGGEAAAPASEQQQQQQQEQQQVAMEVDRPAAAASSAGSSQGWYVARSFAAMAAALQGSNSAPIAEPDSLPAGGRPVADALQQGLVAWRPRQQSSGAAGGPASASSRCLLEASVQPVKTGAVAEGAALCFIAGWEAERLRTPVAVLSAKQQRRRARETADARAALVEAGGDPAEAAAGAGSGSWAEVGEDQVQVFGFVLSAAPRGAPRRCGSLAAVVAPAAWRLRSLQHWAPRQDGGAIEALVRNPGSASLFPVRLQLLAEQPQPA